MPIYIKFEVVPKGESKTKGHEGDKGWVEINSWSFGANRNIAMPVGGSTKREASAPSVSEIVVTKLMDSTSPLFLQESVMGKAGKVEIHATTTGEKLETYMEITLTNVLISGYNVSSGGDRPTESLTLNYTKIEMKYTPYGDDHKAGTPTSSSFDLAQGTK